MTDAVHCPICGAEPTQQIMALMVRRDDDGRERVCKLVVKCPNDHGPFWRWADREDDPLLVDATWGPAFARQSPEAD